MLFHVHNLFLQILLCNNYRTRPLVTFRIQTVFWTDVLAILSVVQTIALGTFPGDRLTGPTTPSTSSTVWSKVIRRAYCNKVNFHIKSILFRKGNVKQNLEIVHYLNSVYGFPRNTIYSKEDGIIRPPE